MRPIRTFTVIPSLPPRLERLRELAYNLRWSWDYETLELFRRLDLNVWEASGHNPVRMLGMLRQETLQEAANDDSFLSHLGRVADLFDEYMNSKKTWFRRNQGGAEEFSVAYFSMEFGISESLPNYSGGLGVLAGDHLKSASDLGVPLTGVGLLYQEGYFRQYLNADGWQGELYPDNDFFTMPLCIERKSDGTPVVIQVEYPGRMVRAQVWRAQVGRVPLYLLDTNIAGNRPEDRDVTDRLYGGDIDMRIRQEILLGIGGIRALAALGINPTICHMNEGHSAFLAFERIRNLMVSQGVSFEEAREAAVAGIVFTTHTPVPAGIDMFGSDMIERYFGGYYRSMGLTHREFMALGRQDPGNDQEPFSMAIAALRLSAKANGVSRLHGEVSRKMWQGVWPGVPEDEVPISSITNGVHPTTWVSGRDVGSLFDRYLGPRWKEEPTDPAVWEGVEKIPGEELWRAHERCRERLVSFARQRLVWQLERRGAPSAEIERAREVLNPEALTIGFSRRFATYKRANLLFRHPERLRAILSNRERPVQIVISGKAHPNDIPGKELIRQVVHFARQEEFRRQIVFLEDYDMVVARYLVRGADLWLTTPRRPLEASGTSGMKVAFNGGLNMSVQDGWWCEAYDPSLGWSIGRGEEYQDEEYQDEVESNAIYNLLEQEVVPLFYSRGSDGLPRGWIARMKNNFKRLCPVFNTNRMVMQYLQEMYLPSSERSRGLIADGMARARALARWKRETRDRWSGVQVLRVEAEVPSEVQVGSLVEVRADVRLGEIRPEDVTVELYHGSVDSNLEIRDGVPIGMICVERNGDGTYGYSGAIPCSASGVRGYALRVLPRNEDLSNPYETGLILWA
ncbi:MAG: alpha-glucan family phosphorylase [Sphingomonadaceae bacterium]